MSGTKTTNLGLNKSIDDSFDYLDYRYKQLFDENWDIIDSTVFNPSAAQVSLNDAGNYFNIDNVEAALQQTMAELRSHEGSGGATVHPLVTSTVAGFMDPLDKQKLDGIAPNGINQQTGDARYVLASGSSMTGPLTLPSDPTLSLQAATKQYVDAVRTGADNKFLQLGGGTMNGPITLSGAPINDLHAATKKYVDDVKTYADSVKTYVDSVKQALDIKDSVKVATTGNINLSANIPKLTIDGILTQTNDRVLVKDQGDPSQNGIYTVQADGSFVRAVDANTSTKVTSGMFTFVEQGTANGDSGWVLTTDGTITLDSTSLSFTQFSGAGQIAAGTGLQKVGSTLSLENTGVAAGTYTSVQVDLTGRVISASNPVITAANVTITDAANNFTSTNVEGALSELFTSVSNGKNSIASAITGKGVTASGSDTFSQLSTKISQISTGVGNAVAADVLTGKTFTNGTSAGLTGSMPNNGGVVINPTTSNQTIALGYHNGTGYVNGDTNLAAGNIVSGKSIFGVAGTFSFEAAGTAASTGDLLTGKNAYVNGVKIIGAMVNNGGVTINPTTTNQTIALGYHNGSGVVVGDPNLLATNIVTGKTIFGVAGNFSFESGSTAITTADVLTGKNGYANGAKVVGAMPNRGAVAITPSTTSQTIALGYHNGSGTVAGDVNLIAANIISGKTIFGVAGTAIPITKNTGTATTDTNGRLTVSLSFKPKMIFVKNASETDAFKHASYDEGWSSTKYIVDAASADLTGSDYVDATGFSFMLTNASINFYWEAIAW